MPLYDRFPRISLLANTYDESLKISLSTEKKKESLSLLLLAKKNVEILRPSLFRVVFIRPIEALAANQIAWPSGVSHSREAKKRAARGSGKGGRYTAKRGEGEGEREEG